jgi:hypothetical protein
MKRFFLGQKGEGDDGGNGSYVRIGIVIYELLNKYCNFITAEKTT